MTLIELGEPSIPEPFMLNPWKHHLGHIRQQIATTAAAGEAALSRLVPQLVILGNDVTDLYLGPLSIPTLLSHLYHHLIRTGRLEPTAYAAWLAANGGYQVVAAPDGSRWTLRLGYDAHASERYVHLHPGRYSPGTIRVRAMVLRNAIVIATYARIQSASVDDLALLNAARAKYLALPPVPTLNPQEGLGLLLGYVAEA